MRYNRKLNMLIELISKVLYSCEWMLVTHFKRLINAIMPKTVTLQPQATTTLTISKLNTRLVYFRFSNP